MSNALSSNIISKNRTDPITGDKLEDSDLVVVDTKNNLPTVKRTKFVKKNVYKNNLPYIRLVTEPNLKLQIWV